MTSGRIASRYAEALFGLAQERAAVGALRAELRELAELVKQTPALAVLLERPDVDAERKLSFINAALGDRFSEAAGALIAVLVRHRRGEYVPEVAAAFDEMADEAAGVVRAEASSVVPLSEAQRSRLTTALSRMTGKRVELEERIDPEILAGVRVRVGDRLIDGSAAGRLERLREELTRSGP